MEELEQVDGGYIIPGAHKVSDTLCSRKIHSENQKKNLRYADIFTNLANLVFGGIIIGGVFENMEHPIYLYLIGFSVFFILIWLGNVYYNKGIKEL